MHAWGHTTDWRYGRGVPVHVPKHMCSIQVSRRSMDGARRWLAVGSWVPGLGTPKNCTVVFGVGHSRESHGSLWGWALQRVSR